MDFGDPTILRAIKPEVNGRAVESHIYASEEIGSAPSLAYSCREAIETSVKGDFEGWDDDTIYAMQDGSVWQQSGYHYHYHYAFEPNVLIYKARSGACHIKVEGDDDEGVDVQRLK